MPIPEVGNAALLFDASDARRRALENARRRLGTGGAGGDGGPVGAGGLAGAVDVDAAPLGPASVLETPRAGFFYPRIIFGGGAQLDFTTPANPLISEGGIKGENVSLAGFQETLSVRLEPRLTLGFTILSHDNLIAVRNWWKDWARLGRQSAIILDRFGTCGNMYEYDVFNTAFDKAHCLYNPFEPRRFAVARELWTLQLVFRQGQDETTG